MNQTTIFDMLYPKYKITKPIRLIELFAGYGSQALALKYLGVKFEHWKLCEWAVKSIQAYKDIHYFYDETYPPLLENKTKKEMVDYLFKKGISANYNEPMTWEQINRLSENQLRNILNNVYQTHNLVNIQQVKGKDLEIIDTDKYEYIMTYSFPCQDLSLAGKGKGMSDTTTRSGLLWEVERILTECKELGTMPQVLLMENVPQVHSQDNMADFHKWQVRLEELGYKNYWQDLIATDYGIPQTRIRCYMVSILGNYNYTFPKSKPLKLKLKDMLEKKVDEKYYFINEFKPPISKIIDKGNYIQWQKKGWLEHSCRAWKESEISETLTTRGGSKVLLGKQLLQTIAKIQNEEIVSLDLYNRQVVKEGLSQTIDTGYHNSQRLYDLKGVRKLTPKECFRLMGVKDQDYDKVCKNQSDASLYHLAGDSIVVNVLMAIFKELL